MTVVPASEELGRQLDHYTRQKRKWMTYYYSTKVAIIVLAAAIPVMTTISAWPWTIAVVGGLIAVVEGVSQLWHFHDRFVAARAVLKGLDRERIRYGGSAAEYGKLDDLGRNQLLAARISALLDRHEAEGLSVLKTPSPTAGAP